MTRMKNFFLAALCSLSINVINVAQTHDFYYKVKHVPLAKPIHAVDSIVGQEVLFDKRIVSFYPDEDNKAISLEIRDTNIKGTKFLNSGFFLVYDYQNHLIKWSRATDFLNSKFEQVPALLIESTLKKSLSRDLQTGNIKWEATTDMYYVQKESNIAIGYPFLRPGTRKSDVLKGIDLDNGKELWQRVMPREYGWNDVFDLNDSMVCVVANGLQAVNIKDGSGWAYYTQTGTSEINKGSLAATGLGIGLGLLTGYYYYGISQDVLTGIVSNPIYANDKIYLASREKISCVNALNGKVIWSKPLVENMASSGTIFLEDGLVYQVNLGKANLGGVLPIKCGSPYIVVYDSENGSQGYLSMLPLEGFVSDLSVGDNYIEVVGKSQLIRVAKQTGEIVKVYPLGTGKENFWTTYIREPLFYKQGNRFKLLQEEYPEAFFLRTSEKEVLRINHDLNMIGKFNSEDFWQIVGVYKDLTVLMNRESISVVQEDGAEVLTFERKEATPFLVEHNLFIVHKYKLQKINIQSLTGKLMAIAGDN